MCGRDDVLAAHLPLAHLELHAQGVVLRQRVLGHPAALVERRRADQEVGTCDGGTTVKKRMLMYVLQWLRAASSEHTPRAALISYKHCCLCWAGVGHWTCTVTPLITVTHLPNSR